METNISIANVLHLIIYHYRQLVLHAIQTGSPGRLDMLTELRQSIMSDQEFRRPLSAPGERLPFAAALIKEPGLGQYSLCSSNGNVLGTTWRSGPISGFE